MDLDLDGRRDTPIVTTHSHTGRRRGVGSDKARVAEEAAGPASPRASRDVNARGNGCQSDEYT